MQLQHAADGPAPTARQQQVERDDRDGEDDADQALGQHAQRAAGGKGVAVQPRVLRLRASRFAQDDSLGGDSSVSQKQSIASVSQRQTIASGMRMRVKRKMPGEESRISAA
jgi:hypothetical protein